MQIILRKIDELNPYANNPRTHSDAQIRDIERSLLEYGWTNPVLMDTADGIVAGHCRVMAATRIYAAGKTINDAQGNPLPHGVAPCIVLSALTDAQRRAYIIADNKFALSSGWNDELLSLELTELKELDFDLSLTGFNLSELDEYGPLPDIDILEPTAGGMSSGNYGDARGDRIPVNIMGIGGLLDRSVMERVRDKLILAGADKERDNSDLLQPIFQDWVS